MTDETYSNDDIAAFFDALEGKIQDDDIAKNDPELLNGLELAFEMAKTIFPDVRRQPRRRMQKRSVQVSQVCIEGAWIDEDLIDQLVENSGDYGFDTGRHVLQTAENEGILGFLENQMLATRSTRGGWYGTQKLKELMGSDV